MRLQLNEVEAADGPGPKEEAARRLAKFLLKEPAVGAAPLPPLSEAGSAADPTNAASSDAPRTKTPATAAADQAISDAYTEATQADGSLARYTKTGSLDRYEFAKATKAAASKEGSSLDA